MPQTSIPDTMQKAYAGQISEGFPKAVRSARAEGTGISAGTPVKRGTAPADQVAAFEAGDSITDANFAGIVILETARPPGGIAAGDSVQVMRLGSVFLEFSEAVTAGEQVHITLASGALLGVAQGTSPAAGNALLPGLRIVETTATAGLACVEVDLFGESAVNPIADLGGLEFATGAALPAFAGNDCVVPSNPASGSVFSIPATAGASTVTLPAVAVEGTVIYFVANGTANGHTVQYRDATGPVNLTAALTASKRHLVTAVHLGDAWYCQSTVAP